MDFTTRDLIESIFKGLTLAGMFFIYEYSMRRFSNLRKPAIVPQNMEWKDVSTIPKHKYNDSEMVDLIITDGNKVTAVSSDSLKFNELGQVVMSYKNSLVTQWQYMPNPPLK